MEWTKLTVTVLILDSISGLDFGELQLLNKCGSIFHLFFWSAQIILVFLPRAIRRTVSDLHLLFVIIYINVIILLLTLLIKHLELARNVLRVRFRVFVLLTCIWRRATAIFHFLVNILDLLTIDCVCNHRRLLIFNTFFQLGIILPVTLFEHLAKHQLLIQNPVICNSLPLDLLNGQWLVHFHPNILHFIHITPFSRCSHTSNSITLGFGLTDTLFIIMHLKQRFEFQIASSFVRGL